MTPGTFCRTCGRSTEDNPGAWSPLFCAPCDYDRMVRLNKQLGDMAKDMGMPESAPQPMRGRKRNEVRT